MCNRHGGGRVVGIIDVYGCIVSYVYEFKARSPDVLPYFLHLGQQTEIDHILA
jgi:hypothetical protein